MALWIRKEPTSLLESDVGSLAFALGEARSDLVCSCLPRYKRSMPGLFIMHPWSRRVLRSFPACALVLSLSWFINLSPVHASAAQGLSWTPLDGVSVGVPGVLRLVGSRVDGMEVRLADPELGDQLAEDLLGQARLVLRPQLRVRDLGLGPFQSLSVDLEADLTSSLSPDGLTKPLAYDPVFQERTLAPSVRMMVGNLAIWGPGLRIQAGLIRSSWGVGMLANGGERGALQSGGSPFGVIHNGDRVARFQLLWMTGSRGDKEKNEPPRFLGISLAADAVVDDDTANWLEGDRTFHALAAIRGRHGRLNGGLYMVHRVQEHAAGGQTRVEVLDGHLQHTLVRGPIRAWFEAELAAILGETTFVSSAAEPGPYQILSTGGVLRVGLNVGDLSAVVESGAASGDNNPYDDQLREFSFDRSFKVGLLMFGEGLRQISAVSAYNVADPGLKGAPPRGFDRIPSGGAVRGATYVNPRLVWTPAPYLSLYLGYVHAESEEDYTDPFQSGLAGGESRGPLGAPGQRNLGDEVDVGISTSFGATAGAKLQARLEGGWWRPGSVFQDPGGASPKDILGVTATVEASW